MQIRTTGTIQERIAHIQKVLTVEKTHFNSFGGYSYRTAEDILNNVKKILEKDEWIKLNTQILTLGTRFYIEVEAQFWKETEMISAKALAREADQQKGMNDAQITGSAISFAKKYALCNLFAIDDGIDDDKLNQIEHSPKIPNPEVPKPKVLPQISPHIAFLLLGGKWKTNDFIKNNELKRQILKGEKDVILADPNFHKKMENTIKNVIPALQENKHKFPFENNDSKPFDEFITLNQQVYDLIKQQNKN